MQELMQKRKEQLAQATITQLRRRGFEAEWFDTAARPVRPLSSCCPKAVRWPGAVRPPSGRWG